MKNRQYRFDTAIYFIDFSPIPVINWNLITWLLPIFIDWLALEYQQEKENKGYLKNSKTYIKI